MTARRQLLRLDCMNPRAALGPPVREEPIDASAELGAAELTLTPCAGVRSALAALLRGRPAVLPVDVYPVYWELAAGAPVGYPTFPRPSLPEAAADAVIVIPEPLTPLGRYLTAAEHQAVAGWVEKYPRRLVIFDCAYHLGGPLPDRALQLARAGRAVLLWSLSKSRLKPGFGAAVSARPLDLPPPPGPLAGDPELPARMAALFTRRWAALCPRLRALDPLWSPPQTGYFSTVQAPFEALLETGVLGVPATVFGRGRHTVITCLHESLG